jgi:hypothetical protein
LHTSQVLESNAILVHYLPVEVAQERELEMVLVGPGFLRPGRVYGDSYNLSVHGIELVTAVSESAHLSGAHARESSREERQDHILALELAETPLLAVGIVQSKVRR